MSVNKKSSFGVILIKFFIILYDIISYPIYSIIQRPWEAKKLNRRVRAKRENPNDPHSAYVRVGDNLYHYITKCKTIPEAQRMSLLMNGRDRPSLGFRKILAEEEEKQSNGKILRKWKLSDYKWLTIGEVDQLIGDIARGLLANGVKPKDNVLLFSDTRLGKNLADSNFKAFQLLNI